MKLLATSDRKRFYLVPDDTSFRAGSLALSTMAGDTLMLRPDDLVGFEVPEGVARAFAAERAGRMTAEMADMQVKLDQVLAQARNQMSHITEAAGFGRSPEALLASLGVEANQDPNVVLRRLAEMVQTLGQDLPRVVDGTLGAQEKLAQLDKTLGGTPDRDPVQELLRTVAAPGTSPELQRAAQELAALQARLRSEE